MSQNNDNSNYPCAPCGLQDFERNRYFDGKLLVTRDFQGEQSYFKGKQRLHNSMLHGYGTVCGLKIEPHPNSACRHQYVVLNPGLALDCCGNEIVVREQTIVDLRQEIETALRQKNLFPESGNPDPLNVYIRLAYREGDVEQIPALLDDCGHGETHTEFNRTRETYQLFVDLDDPVREETDPLDARLEWQHTLSMGRPSAMVVDRQLMRFYATEWDGTTGWLRVYDASNHSLVVPPIALAAPENSLRLPQAAARSNLGDLIYVALVDSSANETAETQILIFAQAALEQSPETALKAVLPVQGRVRHLTVSPRDDALFALLDDGRLCRWSSESLRAWVEADGSGAAPEPTMQALNAAFEDPSAITVRPITMTVSFDGRWLVVAAHLTGVPEAEGGLIAVSLPQFESGGDVSNLLAARLWPSGERPNVVKFGYDAKFLYVLCPQSRMLYRLEVREELASLIPIVPAEGESFSAVRLDDSPGDSEPPETLPVDIEVSPRGNWLYVLRRLRKGDELRDRGDVQILSIEVMDRNRGPAPIDLETTPGLRRGSASTEGIAKFQTLGFIGQRLYVVGFDKDSPDPEGSISILFVDEAACDTFIRKTIEGCLPCDDPKQGVILASMPLYQWDEAMVEDEADGPNVIDNETDRPLVPSTNTLRQVVECMLKKGISEGIPGPRGVVGPEGARGPGITGATATTLEPISGDPEGDQRLILGIPPGLNGAPGARGPGITQVRVETLDPGLDATAELQPITGDPEGDQSLLLGIPRGAPGDAPPEPFNHVINASWHHDEILRQPERIQTLLGLAPETEFPEVNFVIEFAQEVLVETLNDRSVFLLARRQDPEQPVIFHEFQVLTIVEPLVEVNTDSTELNWLVGNQEIDGSFETIVDFSRSTSGGNFAKAVRLRLPEELNWQTVILKNPIDRLTVVLRGDWILDEKGRALDGNHIWPGVPDIKTSGTAGGDWRSILHIPPELQENLAG